MINKNKGFSIVEAMVAVTVMGVTAIAVSSLVTYMNAGINNSKSQMGSQSLRSTLTNTIVNANLCTQALTPGLKFNAQSTDVGTNGTGGLPLNFTLADGTQISGVQPGVVSAATPLPNYAVKVDNILFQTVGPAKNLKTPANTDLVDPTPGAGCSTTNNKIFPGDVYLSVEKSGSANNVAGGVGIKPAYLGTVMLTVDTATQTICRCYAPDSCAGIGGTYNPAANAPCQLCPVGQTWIGYNTQAGANFGKPVCLPSCPAGQFLVGDGLGGAVCKVPPVDGKCGTAVGGSYSSAPTSNLCAIGSASPSVPTQVGSLWNWQCLSPSGTGLSPACTANVVVLPVASCGLDNGQPFYVTAPPGGNLCSPAGATASGFSLNAALATWNWTCNGSNSVACYAQVKQDGVCGAAISAAASPTAPSSNLCVAPSTASPAVPTISGTNWNWSCLGVNNAGVNNGKPVTCVAAAVVGPTPTPTPCSGPLQTWTWVENGIHDIHSPGGCKYSSQASWVTAYSSLVAANPPPADLNAFNTFIATYGPGAFLWCPDPSFCEEHGQSGSLNYGTRRTQDPDPTSPCRWAGNVTFCSDPH